MERSEIPMQTMWAEHSLKEVPMDTQQEFQQFYQENLGLTYRYVYNQVGNRDEAEDLTSQIFLKVVSNIDHERSRLSMKKWPYCTLNDRGPLASSLSSPNEFAG